MKPYLKDKQMGIPKLKAEKTDHVGGYSKGVSKSDKLITKNANRSRKKSKRQESKKEIMDQVDDLNSYMDENGECHPIF